jgi:RNaseH domain of pPIWI_RE/pPIWI_RE module N-terminal domain/MID domain of pPIWI_RE
MLTLAFTYTPAIAGTVFCLTVTPELAEQWGALTRQHARENQNLPYHDLSQALKFVLGDFAAVCKGPDGTSTLVLTRKAPPDGLIVRLFSGFEQALAHRHDVTFQNRLAPLLASLKPSEVHLSDHLTMTGPTGEPDPPKWVYDVATWHAAELLTKQPLRLPSGRGLLLRADTDGNLLAWHDLLPDNKGERTSEQAMHYLSLSAITLPGHPGLLLSLDAHISRLTHFLGNARTVWLAAGDDRLILSAGFRYDSKSKRRTLRGAIAELTDSFTLRGIPELDDDILRREPDRVRARYHSTPADHPVGPGPGRKFLDLVLAHAAACLPAGTAPLELADSQIRGIDRSAAARKDAKTPHDRMSLARTLERGSTRLHLNVVFATDALRARATRALVDTLGTEPGEFSSNDTFTVVPDRLRVTFTHAATADLLIPGDAAPRAALARTVRARVEPGWIGAVLAETCEKTALAGGAAAKHDPKRQGRRAYASHGFISQYLDMASMPRSGQKDHPAGSALLDLLRSAGLTGTRPGGVFKPPLSPQPAVLVGIYSRTQNQPASRMISLAAIVAHGADAPWETLAYHPGAGGWGPYPEAVAAHHADVLTPFGRDLSYPARNAKAAEYAHRALNQLLIRHPGLPMVLFADGVGCRSLWPGLANRTLGLADHGAMPQLGLANADERQVSLVRVITSEDNELPQPVRATVIADGDTSDAFVPASTKLYRLTSSKAAAYYLVNRSRTDQAYDWDVRDSHRKTRFGVAGNPKALRTPWHAMTCTEFTIIDPGTWTGDELAALSARLCGHPLAWDGRTSRPIPLHGARQIIEDHPDRT